MNSKKFAFVILNYKTYGDTILLIKDLKEQVWYERIKIFVVENGSCDESENELNKFKEIMSFDLIVSDINLGFANGNNLGIKKAKEEGFEYIICSNSDIKIDKQDSILNVIENIYSTDTNIAILAPHIINQNYISQNPFRKYRFTKKEILKMKLFYLMNFYKIYYFLRIYTLYNIITFLAERRNFNRIKKNTQMKQSSAYIYAPHGSFIIFTPTFFNYFKGFDTNTFLYCEEFILAEAIFQKQLKVYYENSIEVLHNESSSTNEILNNYKDKVKFTLKNTFESCKYFSKTVRL